MTSLELADRMRLALCENECEECSIARKAAEALRAQHALLVELSDRSGK